MRGQRTKFEDNHRIHNNILEKQCKECKKWYPCSENYFYKNNKNKTDGLFPNCKTCVSAKSYKYKLNHMEDYEKGLKKFKRTEKYREIRRRQNKDFKNQMKQWANNNRDKIHEYAERHTKNKSHNISKEELQELYTYCESSCMYCGISEREAISLYGQKLHKDHAYNDGSGGIENCVLACKQCNSSKRDLDWDDWFQPPNLKFDTERFNKIKSWLVIKGNENFKSE